MASWDRKPKADAKNLMLLTQRRVADSMLGRLRAISRPCGLRTAERETATAI